MAWMMTMDFRTDGEVLTNTGRIDAVLEASDLTVVTELKYSAETPSKTL
jgi:hypothetical protein